ncbi:MAG: DUF2024 family protein [Balneola sp.]
MKVGVWDTYVTKKDGSVMHFDIIVPAELKDKETIFGYGFNYLSNKEVATQTLTSKECEFCHIESVKPEWEKEITDQGYFIFEMENCND